MCNIVYFSEQLLKDHKHNGFPVIVDHRSQMLSGFVTRRDLKVALRKSIFLTVGNVLVLMLV